MRATRVSTCLGLVGLSLSACTPRHVRVPDVRPPSTTPAASQASPWRPVPIAPKDLAEDNVARFPLANGTLVMGPSGERWLLPTVAAAREGTAPPRVASEVDTVQILGREFDPQQGFVVVSTAGELFHADDPVGALASFGTLPAGATGESVRFHRGAAIALARGRAFVLEGGKPPRPVPPLGDHEIGDLRLGPDGRGVALFLPETVASTDDFGASWRLIATPGVRVDTIDVSGNELRLLPGGVRDGFPRAVDEQTGALSRAVPLEAELPARPQRRPDRRTMMPDERPEPPAAIAVDAVTEALGATAAPVRFVPQLAFSGDRFAAAVGGGRSGDEVLAFFPRTEDGALRTGMYRGRLGEGLLPFDRDTLAGCVVQTSALCDDRTAVVCGQELFVFEGARLTAKLPVPLDNATLAFDDRGAPIVVGLTRDDGPKRLLLARFDRAGGRAEATPSVVAVDGLRPTPARLTGGCHAPALWLATDRARRWSPTLRALEPPVDLPPASWAVAVRHDGSLVNSDGQSLVFVPSGGTVAIGAHAVGQVAFAEDGRHALFSAASGQVLQSNDGGASFSPIASPGVEERQPIVCGRTRCQLGPGAFREGFARGAEPVAPWIVQQKRSARDLSDEASFGDRTAPVVMTCKDDPTLFAGAASALLTPRLGATLYAGIISEPTGRTMSVWGDREGRETRVALPPFPPSRRLPADFHFSFVGTGASAEIAYHPDGTTRTTALFRWDASSRPQTLVTLDAQPTFHSRILAEDGIVSVGDVRGELMIWGGMAVERRTYINHPDMPSDGIMARGGDDTWWIAQNAIDAVGAMRLDRLPKDRPGTTRTLRVRGPEAIEGGVGFAIAGDTAKLFAIEGTPEGGIELRWHALSDELSLGPPHAVPGTRAAAGRLLDLPTCPADARGALIRTSTQRLVNIRTSPDTGIEPVFLARLLRADEKGACVERTFVPSNWGELIASLVVAGNGGIAGQAGSPGARCSPVDPVATKPTGLSAPPLRAIRR